MAKVKCKRCGNYVERDSAFRRGLSNWCDDDCFIGSLHSGSAKSQKLATRRGPIPKRVEVDGSNGRVDYSEITEEVAEEVLATDGYRCRLCGKAGDLVIHHVKYRSEARFFPWCSQPENLISLHNEPCHLSIVHRNKKKWQPLALEIIRLRELGDKTTTMRDLDG